MTQPNSLTQLCPFRGIRYDPASVGDLSSLLCPPYDIISPTQQRELYARAPHNMIRLEHPLSDSEVEDESSKYRTAAVTYHRWIREGILFQETAPALYVHDHEFEYRGRRHVRRGLVGAVQLRPWYDGVYPHELTGTKAKQDRLELMRACKASFSYPLGLYEDSQGLIAGILAEAVSGTPPLAEARESGDSHWFWSVQDGHMLARLQKAFTTESIYIADGHHRYETGLVYQSERRSAEKDPGRLHEYDFIPMTLTAFDDPGLFISPVYRVLAGVELPDAAEIERRLNDYFTIDYVPLDVALTRSDPAGENALMAVVGLRQDSVGELRPRAGYDLAAEVPGEHSTEYRNFNVSILNYVVMSRALGIDPDGEGVSYSPDLEGVIDSVRAGEAKMAFLLSPAHPLLVKKIADQMERMPRKSTYFYPKPPTGLVAYPLL